MKAYLAGPDVFRADSIDHGEYLKSLCADAGLTGMYPLDNAIPDGMGGADAAQWVCDANLQMLVEADVVIANLAAFRGSEPDSGTVFEMGVAVAMGKPVFAYFPDQGSMRQQISTDEQGFCREGMFVEDFGLPRNLMLACRWSDVAPTVEQAISRAADHIHLQQAKLCTSPGMR